MRSDETGRLPPALEALAARQRTMLGVVDIGSNSLRLVLYDRLSRAPVPLFNEKVMCALGRGLNATGRLNADGVGLARDNIERFVLLSRRLGVARLDVLATSAVRDASDGPAFVAEVEARCGIRITVVPGDREARLAAAGVRAGIPEAEGVTGDLGGGSVELAVTGRTEDGPVASLPIGPLRLQEASGDELKPRTAIERAVASVDWLGIGRGKPFYAVGGTWRSIARIHMEQQRYPLHIIQNYAIPRAEAESFLEVLSRMSRRSVDKVVGISRRRLETVPLAAYTLYRLIRAVQPSTLVFSGYGLREGHLFELLGPEEQRRDPLLVAARQMAEDNPRFGSGGEELVRWTTPLFPAESAETRRLRQTAALLSDLGWSEHPDYRAQQIFARCLRMPVPGIDHQGRVFVAVALHARYGGAADSPLVGPVRNLIDEASFGRARAIGAAFRLAYTLTGGAPGLIGEATLSVQDQVLVLGIPEHTAIYTGEAVQRRLETLGRVLGRRVAVRMGG
jgi:exopolyphosphatase/guanosine-5'-triphosphate,3'-diphosphate pyrophosphatase